MKKIILFSLLLICFFCLIFPFFVIGQNDKVTTWLDENSVKINTVQPENGFDDLLPLKKNLKGKRIVGLGEATHGTKEFFQMKHRMLEFLVKEMGFRCFAIEANLTEAYAVNDYVMYGKGDPQKALDGLYFWTWNTKEVMAMIEWMREYNSDKQDKEKVKFYGFDMQTSDVALAEFYKYIQRVDSVFANKVDYVRRNVITLINKTENPLLKQTAADIRKVLAHIDEEKVKYIFLSSKWEYDIQRQNLMVVLQGMEMRKALTSFSLMFFKRDSCMSENVKWLMHLEGDSSKFVLWAHNGHIAKKPNDPARNMGYNLNKLYKEQYYALGFDFYSGSFQARKKGKALSEFNITSKKNSSGYFFSQSQNEIFFFDMAKAKENPDMKKFIHKVIPSIVIGAIFSGKYVKNCYTYKPLDVLYDGLIFIRNTNRAEPCH